MKRFILVVFGAGLLMLGLSGCKITSAVEGQDKSVRVCKNTTKLILSTYKDLQIPDHLRTDHPTKDRGDFELASLVGEMDHVTVNEGFQVDYVYTYRNAMGRPLVYSLPRAQKVFNTEDEFKAGKPLRLTYALETTDQRWGFLQLAILEELGDQFYQYYTAEYDDNRIICDIDDIELLIDQLASSEVHSPMDWWQKMRALTISETDPIVNIYSTANTVEVSLLLFDSQTGIVRRTYVYSYLFPHELLETIDEVIVGYRSELKQTSKR